MKKQVSLVLSSGGARGVAHIGVIEELEKQGFEIKSIAGTSMVLWWEECMLPENLMFIKNGCVLWTKWMFLILLILHLVRMAL